jgi:hypothetical protein
VFVGILLLESEVDGDGAHVTICYMLPGPKTPSATLAWVQEAMAAGRYIPDPHFEKRCRQRHYSIFDAKRIAATASTCEPYPEAKLLGEWEKLASPWAGQQRGQGRARGVSLPG